MTALFHKSFNLHAASYQEIKTSLLSFLKENHMTVSSIGLVIFEELVMNVLLHGKAHGGSVLTVFLKQKRSQYHFLCVDNSSKFNCITYTPQFESEKGGLGLLFVKKLSQKLYYKRFQKKNYVWALFH